MKQGQTAVLERFLSLPRVAPGEIVGLWQEQSIPTGHPLDNVLENLGWLCKRFRADMRADALLFQSSEDELVRIDPACIPLRLVLGFLSWAMGAARNLFLSLKWALLAEGTVARLATLDPFR